MTESCLILVIRLSVYQIPENMTAVAVPTTETSGIGGYIMPGDNVDVLVSYAPSEDQKLVVTQLENVKILEKGPYTTGAEEIQTVTYIVDAISDTGAS